jgi:hypothetical protein
MSTTPCAEEVSFDECHVEALACRPAAAGTESFGSAILI